MADGDIKPSDIFTPEALDDAFALDMAMGGSTNTVLHLLAAAHEAGIDYDLDRINQMSERVPYLCKVSPAIPDVHMEDVDKAGGIPAILAELNRAGLLHPDRPTVTGRPMGDTFKGAKKPPPGYYSVHRQSVSRHRRIGRLDRQPRTGGERGQKRARSLKA